jgi:hypothetical protein
VVISGRHSFKPNGYLRFPQLTETPAMTTPADNASNRSAMGYRDSAGFGLNGSGTGNAIDLIALKPDAGKDVVGTGRLNDHRGPLRNVPVEPVAARSPAAPPPSHPIIPAAHFVEAGGVHDPRGISAANVKHGSAPQHGHVSARRNPLHQAPSRPSSGTHTPGAHAKPSAGKPVRQAVPQSVHAIDEAAKKLRAIAEKYPADSTKALQAVNDVYAGAPKAPPDIRDAILHNPDALRISERAAKEANAPLTEKTELPQQQAHAAVLNLQQATRRLDANLAGVVVALAVPGYEAFYESNENHIPGDGLFGPIGGTLLREVTSHIAGTRQDDDVTTRFIAIGGLNYDLDKAAGEVKSARDKLDHAHLQTMHGAPAAGNDVLQQKLNAATARLNAVVAAEIAISVSMGTRVGIDTDAAKAARAAQAGQRIVAGYADDHQTQNLVEAAVKQVLYARDAKAIAREAQIQAAISKYFSKYSSTAIRK